MEKNESLSRTPLKWISLSFLFDWVTILFGLLVTFHLMRIFNANGASWMMGIYDLNKSILVFNVGGFVMFGLNLIRFYTSYQAKKYHNEYFVNDKWSDVYKYLYLIINILAILILILAFATPANGNSISGYNTWIVNYYNGVSWYSIAGYCVISVMSLIAVVTLVVTITYLIRNLLK
jgi:hypothetical protein